MTRCPTGVVYLTRTSVLCYLQPVFFRLWHVKMSALKTAPTATLRCCWLSSTKKVLNVSPKMFSSFFIPSGSFWSRLTTICHLSSVQAVTWASVSLVHCIVGQLCTSRAHSKIKHLTLSLSSVRTYTCLESVCGIGYLFLLLFHWYLSRVRVRVTDLNLPQMCQTYLQPNKKTVFSLFKQPSFPPCSGRLLWCLRVRQLCRDNPP